jgi:hypothetical protein
MFDDNDKYNIVHEGGRTFRVIHIGTGKEMVVEAEDLKDAYDQAIAFWRIPRGAAGNEIEIEEPGSNAPIIFINDRPLRTPGENLTCFVSIVLGLLVFLLILAWQVGIIKWPY